jgi:hypothetical protein
VSGLEGFGGGNGLGLGRSGFGESVAALSDDPRDYDALMAGAIWLPGVGETYGANLTVLSQATQVNTIQTGSVTGDIPVPSTAGNGAAYWSYAGKTNPSLAIPKTGALGTGPGAGTALQWEVEGSYAMWVKVCTVQDNASHFIFSHAYGTATKSRFEIRKNLGSGADQDRLVVEMSWDGTTADGTPGSRAKWNSPANVTDFTQWIFVRATVKMSAANYQTAGANKSYRLRVWINEVEISGTFSAPGPGALGGDPPDGPVRDAPFASDSWVSIGASAISSTIDEGMGPVYIANGAVPEAAWPLIMAYRAPGD